jgi:hypothetical protein
MLVLNRSLLNRKYILINVLKALASIISTSNLYVTFLSKITEIFYAIYKWNLSSIQCKMGTQAVDDCEESKSPESCFHLF